MRMPGQISSHHTGIFSGYLTCRGGAMVPQTQQKPCTISVLELLEKGAHLPKSDCIR